MGAQIFLQFAIRGRIGHVPLRLKIGQSFAGSRLVGRHHADQAGSTDHSDTGSVIGSSGVEVLQGCSHYGWA